MDEGIYNNNDNATPNDKTVGEGTANETNGHYDDTPSNNINTHESELQKFPTITDNGAGNAYNNNDSSDESVVDNQDTLGWVNTKK
eukprot:CAMPEP_0114657556 /NCGR_PEP_ID=MMETSP0191-20121206/14144_1 /TAXON_ID=126664 /ORGANISM="Sorites sp." /LENGTH=85 /DNA_ID=CAMNT_0001877253 /DNA_START=1094 /DNA_END=1351 /DNA_ORIENTATION=-